MPDRRLVLAAGGLFALGALLLMLAHGLRRASAERRHEDWTKYGVYAAVVNALWVSAFVGRAAAGLCLAAIVFGGAYELSRVTPARHRVAAASGAAVVFALALGHLLAGSAPAWKATFAFVVMVTASTDSFAQLFGRLLGRRKLCARLSPEKTVAGLVGGLSAAVAVALSLGFLLPDAHGVPLTLLGLLTASAAVAGDLLFSAIKRAAGIKDFSRLLPGHGGLLDRFDSLIVAAPVFYWSRALLLV